MIDHILLDVIAALREAFEGALLEQQAVEERFQIDVFLGDVSFETSYSLPGEGSPPRVRADLSLDWPTWSQSAYRSWSIGEPPAEPPELVIEIALRLQRLVGAPDPAIVLSALDGEGPEIGSERLERAGPMIEQLFEPASDTPACAIEVAYQGSLRLEEPLLDDPTKLDGQVAGLARWVASALVRLADLHLAFLPARRGQRPGLTAWRAPSSVCQKDRPAVLAAERCSETCGCAPRWEMTSAAARAPSRPAASSGAPRTMPYRTPAANRSPAPVVSSTGSTDQAST